MKKMLFLWLLVVISAMGASAQSTNQITVTGQAEVSVAPDVFTVVVSFGETKEFFGKKNIEELEQKVIRVLREHGIDIKKDVSVAETSSHADGKVLINKTITFEVDSYKKYYELSREMDFKGIKRVRITSSRCSKEREIKLGLLPEALKNARAIADAILVGSQMEVNSLLSVNAQSVYISNPRADNAVMLAYGVSSKSSSQYEYIEKPRDVTFSVHMTVTFSMVPVSE